MNDKDSAKLREEIEKILQKTIQFTHNGSGDHIKIDATLAAQAIIAHSADQVAAAELDGKIKILAHILVYCATGKKHVSLSRDAVVSTLADLQRERDNQWNDRPYLTTGQKEAE